MVMGVASALASSVVAGSSNAMPASVSRMPSAASAINGEWAATLTGSTIARFAPSSFAVSAPASMARRSPDTTTWPGEFRFATTNVPWAEALAMRSGSFASSSPMSAAIAPSRPCPEACMSSPRWRTRRTPSASDTTRPATSAEY